MKYSVQLQTINGDWYEDSTYKYLIDAIATLEFHQKVSEQARYGGRVVDVDTKEIVFGDN